MSRTAWALLTILTLAVAVLAVFLVITPGGAREPEVSVTPPVPAPAPAPQLFVSGNVVVTSPAAGAAVSRTFTVRGEARGNWFFEASFPVQVRDPNNNLVGQGIAQAEGEWMTTEFVPFSASIIVENYSGPADLVLLKDNPSGLPEHDDAVLFSIIVQ